MSQIGTTVTTSQSPPANATSVNTGTAFFVGLTDWGPSGSTAINTPVYSLSQAAAVIGGPTGAGVNAARTTTNATMFDSLDAFFREGGGVAYISRVLGPSPVNATLALAPSAALTATAAYPGVGGNQINVAVVNTGGSSVVITLTDSVGNVLATSPSQTTLAGCVSWAATTGLITFTSSGSTLPSTATATALAGGTDGRGSAVLANWTTAINAFGSNLGPGQVLAPGQTNTGLAGIWSSLATHASLNNRIALADEVDGASVATIVSDVSGAALASGVQSYVGIWAGNLLIPGLTSGTTRSVPPSAVIAGLCARVDQTGNQNVPAAGQNFSLQYATTPATVVSGSNSTYSLADANTLNSSGVNTLQYRFGLFENYGFVSLVSPSTDSIYWQLNHARLRMALVADAQIIGEQFVFSQIDGQGADIASFNGAIQSMLKTYFTAGALFGQNPSDAFSVNTGPTVNTPTLLAAGQLSAQCSVRMSPFAQLVSIVLNAVPISQAITQAASPAQNQ